MGVYNRSADATDWLEIHPKPRRALLSNRLASSIIVANRHGEAAFELGSLLVAKRSLAGDDKQAIGADLAGGEKRRARFDACVES